MPPGYKLVPWGQLERPKPNLRGSKLDHQVLKRLEAKNLSKIAFLNRILLLFSGFLDLVFLKLDGRV